MQSSLLVFTITSWMHTSCHILCSYLQQVSSFGFAYAKSAFVITVEQLRQSHPRRHTLFKVMATCKCVRQEADCSKRKCHVSVMFSLARWNVSEDQPHYRPLWNKHSDVAFAVHPLVGNCMLLGALPAYSLLLWIWTDFHEQLVYTSFLHINKFKVTWKEWR